MRFIGFCDYVSVMFGVGIFLHCTLYFVKKIKLKFGLFRLSDRQTSIKLLSQFT